MQYQSIKRGISLLLVLVMVVTMMPLHASAAGTEPHTHPAAVPDSPYQQLQAQADALLLNHLGTTLMTEAQIRAAVENCADYIPGSPLLIDCTDFTDAVRRAATDAKEGDIVLMSPASAAFDQFKNFMVRGNYFKELVKEL